MQKKLKGKLRLQSLLLLASLVLSACATRKPSLSASKQKRAQKQNTPAERPLQQQHRAPPPAYGNKIVLAQGEPSACY